MIINHLSCVYLWICAAEHFLCVEGLTILSIKFFVPLRQAQIHTSLHHYLFLQKLVRFFIFNVIHFYYKKAVLVETGRFHNPPICNVRRMEPANNYPV